MDAAIAVDLAREAIWTAILISAPILLVGVAVGLTIGLLQALTQIQEQTIAIVMKIIVMVFVAAYMFPWMTIRMMEYSTYLITNIPMRMLL